MQKNRTNTKTSISTKLTKTNALKVKQKINRQPSIAQPIP
jgi:hypothetical protein